VQSQICLQRAAEGLAALQRADIPALLMKGAARIACDPASAQERLIRDVDVLVPVDRQQQAFGTLCGEDWSLVPEKWQVAWHKWAPVAAHHAWSLSKGKSEIDLHHFSNHLNRLHGDDDGLWARARALEWRGVAVRVPSSADALMLALTHGVRWSPDASADWVVDASALLDAGDVDWGVFLAEAEARLVQAVVLSGLAYLRDVLHKAVPVQVLEALRTAILPEQIEEMKQYASTAVPSTRHELSTALSMAVQRVQAHARRFGGGPGGPTKLQLLQRSAVQLAEPGRKWILRIPPNLDGAGRILVQVMAAGPGVASEEPFSFTLTAPGLSFGTFSSKPLDAGRAGSPRVAILAFPERLLGLRHIRELRISFKTKYRKDGYAASVSLWRHEGAPAIFP
jgi:hypothetical protein